MGNIYDSYTKDKVKASYYLYAILVDLGLNPSNKGTIYLKELIEYIIINDLYDYSYKAILEKFTAEKHYKVKNVKDNIKNSIYRINYIKAKKNFQKYLSLPFDFYYLSPSKFINIIALKYKD